MANVSESKKKEVAELAKLIDKNPIIAVANLENLPAKQLQIMREKLRGTVLIKMSKARLIKIALDKSKKQDIQQLKDHLKGMPALLFTSQSPFKLFDILKQNKSKAPIKPGQKAPNDIVVLAGPTSFAPGPIIGDLGALRIKTGVENGKVAIKADSLVAKEGDVVSQKLSEVLTRLGIEPMEIGLDLVAAYENGEILTKKVLNIDKEAFYNDMISMHVEALKLAMELGYPTKETITLLIQKAFSEAKTVAIEQGIVSKDVINELLQKADAQANVLQSKINA